jgi:transposase InsO family protein
MMSVRQLLAPDAQDEATKSAGFNFLQQQERLDDFIRVYNHERPHQGLGDAYPGDILEMGSEYISNGNVL